MHINEVIKAMEESRANGIYLVRPHYKNYERLYLASTGSLFYVTDTAEGHHVQPTKFAPEERDIKDWEIIQQSLRLPVKFSQGWGE